MAVIVADRLASKLSARWRVKVVRVLSLVYVAAVLVRVAVVVNNLALIVEIPGYGD